jgi:hypothetical protein
MKDRRLKKALALILFAAVVFIPLHGLAAESIKIEGEVGYNYQVVGNDGQIYEISDSPEGNDLAENFLGEKVKVTGTLEKVGDVQVITVISFEKMAE